MKYIQKLLMCVILASVVSAAIPQAVEACPMCKTANEQDDKKPKAYMYSILFMLAMPAVIFGSFGYGLYRMNQREHEFSAVAADFHADNTDGQTSEENTSENPA